MCVTESMRQAGSDIASHIFDAQVIQCIGGSEGTESLDGWLQSFNGENKDLILKYLNEEIDSVTAIYIAMRRKAMMPDNIEKNT